MRELLLVRKLEEEQAKKKPRDSPDSASALEPSNTSTDSVDAEQPIQSQEQNSSQPDKNNDVHDPSSSEETHITAEDTQYINNRVTDIDTDKNFSLGESPISDNQQQLSSTSGHSINHIEGDSSPGDLTLVGVEAADSSEVTTDSIEDNTSGSDALNLTTDSNVNNEKRRKGGPTELQTKRASLKDFFLHKQSFSISNKDNFTDNLALDSNVENQSLSTLSTSPTSSSSPPAPIAEEEESNHVAKEQLNQETDDNALQNKVASSALPSEKGTEENCDLNSDEKRQRLAAARTTQRKELKNLMRQKKLQKQSEDVDVVIMEPAKKSNDNAQISNDPPTVVVNSAEKDEKTASSRIKRSKTKSSSSADYDSDGSVDLDILIAENSDLDTGSMQLNDDGLNDDDDNFWNIDPAELERHLTPSTTPLRLPSPDLQCAPTMFSSAHVSRPFSMIAEEDENLSDTPLEVDGQEVDDILNSFSNSNNFNIGSKEDEDEEAKIDMMLDAQCTPILKPSSPSPVPSPLPSLSGGKTGIPLGMPKNAFASHFGPPLSPTSSRASSVGDPDEYETMSNGSYTSVRSASSAKSGASGIRRPSTTTGLRPPSRANSHMAVSSRIATSPSSPAATPVRPRSMSIISDSSTEESTTSSRGATSPSRIASPTRGIHMNMYNMSQSKSGSNGRARPVSRIGNGSTEEVLVRPTTNGTSHGIRSLSRAGSQIKSPGIAQSRIRDSVHSASITATKAGSSVRSVSQSQQSPTGLVRPSSRASAVKSPTPGRSLGRFGSLSESHKTTTPTKKVRPQSIHVTSQSVKREQSPNSNNSTFSYEATSGIRSPPSGLRSISHLGGRQSSDSLSSHDDYHIFTPPESPTGASETDSLTSLTSSVSYGSSPGRGTSPVPPYNTSMISPASVIASNSKRTSMISSSTGISKLPSAKVTTTPSKLMAPNSIVASQTHTGLRIPQIGSRKNKGSKE